jgi:hypothetical protein
LSRFLHAGQLVEVLSWNRLHLVDERLRAATSLP